jgi:hypothetical protein
MDTDKVEDKACFVAAIVFAGRRANCKTRKWPRKIAKTAFIFRTYVRLAIFRGLFCNCLANQPVPVAAASVFGLLSVFGLRVSDFGGMLAYF